MPTAYEKSRATLLTGNLFPVADSSSRGVPGGVKQTPAAARYEKRLADGQCTRCAEAKIAPAVDGSQYCAPCGKRERKHQRRSKAAARRANRDRGLCADCTRRSVTYRCLACAIRAGKAPRSGVSDGVKQGGRTDVVTGSDGYTRHRFVGQPRRGAPSAGTDDAQDLKSTLAYVTRALEGQAAVSAAQTARAERDAAEIAWMTKLAQAGRFIDDLLDRRRFDKRQRELRENSERIRQGLAMRGKMGK